MVTLSSRKDLQEIMSSPPTTSYYESTRGRGVGTPAQNSGVVVSLLDSSGNLILTLCIQVTTSYQQNVDDGKSRGHDIELGTRTVDTVRFARAQEETVMDDDDSIEATKRVGHPFAP